MSGVFVHYCPPYFLRQDLSLNLNLSLIEQDWLTSEPKRNKWEPRRTTPHREPARVISL